MDRDSEIPGQTPSPSPIPTWELPPDPPEIKYNWIDITDELKAACDELQMGELVHEPNFGLFEAMSAIEMMDPKMDAGMVGKQTKRKILDLHQAIEAKTIKISDLEFKELIGIMDTSLCCLLSWLEGQTLAHTVFTCLYLHEPDLIEDRCLRAYSICMLKLCDLIREKINKANVFEEEDFQTITYGFKFVEGLSELRVVGMMKEVEDEYSRKLRSLKSKQTEEGQESVQLETTRCNGIIARIRFLRLFLQSLMVFGRKEAESLQQVKKMLHSMLEHLATVGRTIHLGIESVASDDGHMIMHGFEPLVNQKLLPPTFPRYTTLRNREEIVENYEQIIKRLLMVIEVTGLSGYQNILDFFDKFGRTIPCVLSRSILQLTFLPENRKVFGNQVLTECIKDAMRTFNAPPVFSPRCPALQNHPTAKIHAEMFLSRASRAASCLIQTYGHNRARHREKLAAILEEFASLQEEADRIDSDLHAINESINPNSDLSHLTCLGSWTLYHTLRVMTQYVLSGFELELYSPHELHYIYWYLAEILLSWLSTTISRAEQQLTRDEMLGDQIPGRNRNSKKKKNKRKPKIHSKELKLTQGMQMMAAGCFKAVLGFFLSRKLLTPDFLLDSECTRYEHRFLPFVNITTPPFMLYSQFRDMTDITTYHPRPSEEQLFIAASKHFSQAKAMYETIPNQTEEVQNLLKVAKTNLVVTKLLATGHKKDSPCKVEFDFSVHKYFPIFKIA
ncbi:N-alpha-acetyltransferase 35, NatC auxiliary subunit-like [Styela clava]